MPRVPFIGRLVWRQYLALFGSLILIALESILRVLTLALPQPVIRFFYNRSRNLFEFLSSRRSKRVREKKPPIINRIRDADDFVDLCELYGYYAEEHVVQTEDGYLLGLHRLGWKKGEEGLRVNSGEGSFKKRVVYLHHGLLMNSEVWVCITDRERCLPFELVERGYDVWLGNNRGNKYSKKSVHHSPTSPGFWNFSMDEFAFHDIPNSIDYILTATAQAFAALSIHPKLNELVDVFIALAPAMAPAGLSNSVVDTLIKSSPDLLFLAFGRKSILSSATMWQGILYPPIFVRLIDISLSFLFNWSGRNITSHQKLAAYPHLYSFTSTKSVVHWFQIIRNKCFQMYDDEVQAPLSITAGAKYYKVPRFPTRNIKTPIVLVYGGSDSLVDIKVMLKELPKHTIAREIAHFEHLDFLWGADVQNLVFPHVFSSLDAFAHAPNGTMTTRANNITPGNDQVSGQAHALTATTHEDENEENVITTSGKSYAAAASRPPATGERDMVVPPPGQLANATGRNSNHSPSASRKRVRLMEDGSTTPEDSESASTSPVIAGSKARQPFSLPLSKESRSDSLASNKSGDSTSSVSERRVAERGISVGMGKAVSGVTRNLVGAEALGSVDDGVMGSKKGRRSSKSPTT